MDVKTLKKYNKQSISALKTRATYYFNKFIRERDTDENGYGVCISSGHHLKAPSSNAQAGHFYSGGKFPELKFNEDNVHLQGKSDNYFNGGNLLEYRKNLINKIGIKRVEKLDFIVAQNKRQVYKWDRYFLIETIEKYKKLTK